MTGPDIVLITFLSIMGAGLLFLIWLAVYFGWKGEDFIKWD